MAAVVLGRICFLAFPAWRRAGQTGLIDLFPPSLFFFFRPPFLVCVCLLGRSLQTPAAQAHVCPPHAVLATLTLYLLLLCRVRRSRSCGCVQLQTPISPPLKVGFSMSRCITTLPGPCPNGFPCFEHPNFFTIYDFSPKFLFFPDLKPFFGLVAIAPIVFLAVAGFCLTLCDYCAFYFSIGLAHSNVRPPSNFCQ